jgi:ABC-type phosphate transport system substrate-binding protein
MRQLLLLTILLADPSGGAKPAFQIVVNEANPVSALSRQQVSDLFLKKNTQWPGLGLVLPVDQPEASAVRDSFNREIHGKSSSAVRAYWQQRIFSGRDVPPVEKDGDAEVLAYVRKNPGAIGYISSTSSTAGVKVVEVGR